MATVNKDFKIKSGLVVEGTTGTINNFDILTKKQADQDYIVGLIGGTATSANTPNTVVKRDANGDFAAGTITADITGQVSDISNHDTADLAENATNKYFTDTRAKDAVAAALGDGLEYANGTFDVQVGGGIEIGGGTGNEVVINRTTVDAWYDPAGAAAAAQTAAEGYADDLINDASSSSTEVWSAYKTGTEIGLAEDRAKDHADDAVAALVGSAPQLLDTLQELAAALDNDPDAINSLQSIAAGKQDELTAGANIDITGATISVTGLDSADISDFNTAALSATSAAYDAAGAAATAEQNAIAHADALTTDDVAEGSLNLYYTNQRGLEAAAQLLTQADTTNITINGTANGLTIVAENGVADSDTDDLTEGSTNLYFTDTRAVNAIDSATITPNQIDINWARTETASWTAIPTASQAVCHQAGGNYGTIKYLVRVVATIAGTRHSHATEVLATVDGSNGVAVVEYGTIYTSAEPMATVTVLWNGLTNCYELNVTTANNNSEVMVAASALATID